MSKQPTSSETSRPDAGQPSAAPYVVGYKRPPVNTQFKSGQSGNTKGRPKRHRNVRTVLQETLNEKIKVRMGDETRWLTKLEAVVSTIVNGAINRDAKAQASLLALVRAAGMMDEAPETSNAEPMTANDEALLADFLLRCGVGSRQPLAAPQETGGSTAASTSPGKRTAS